MNFKYKNLYSFSQNKRYINILILPFKMDNKYFW